MCHDQGTLRTIDIIIKKMCNASSRLCLVLKNISVCHFSTHYYFGGSTLLLMSWSPSSVVTGVPIPPSAMKTLSLLFALLLVVFHGAAGKM